MGNKKNDIIRIVKGSKRYAGSTDKDISININFDNKDKNYVEKDRSVLLNLSQQFDDERQNSDKFRVAGKITNIYSNDISGTTSYTPFLNSMFFISPELSVENGTPYYGYPPAEEFNFIRTTIPSGHTNYIPKSSSTYNWTMYLSYPFENDTEQKIEFKDDNNPYTNQFTVSDGVPFFIKNRKNKGKNLIYFYCGYDHNLNKGEYIELKQPINGRKTYQVYSIGDEYYGNENRVFTIYNFGYDGFSDEMVGNFKRIIDINNSGETKSSYYCRKHKILTDVKDVDITKLAYENNPFFVKKQMEYSAFTPNNVERLSYKEENQSYGFTFSNDIDISDLYDNNGLPLTSLFVTFIKSGYVGWFNRPYPTGSNTNIQVGWDLNFSTTGITGWWSLYNVDNRDDIPFDSYQINGQNFYHTPPLQKDHILLGDICEWNDYEQKENIVCKINHKINFNPNIFNDGSNVNIPNGYTYKPHYEIPVRVFSDYIEIGETDKVDLIPKYSFYSKYDSNWRWRDIYPYGFIDSDGNGLDTPFINGSHYPFAKVIFLQTPMMRNINGSNSIIVAPNTDDCE